MMNFLLFRIFVILWFTYISVEGVSKKDSDHNATVYINCQGCVNDQPNLSEIMTEQKIKQRLEYISQQLMLYLHTEIKPMEPPKLNQLPSFLIEQLVNPQTEGDSDAYPELAENSVTSKQIVLFPEEGKWTKYNFYVFLEAVLGKLPMENQYFIMLRIKNSFFCPVTSYKYLLR